ncbi:hypothetical protein [Burkholderia thailandensis]|uniref:hypothetical protein n=1 Tax=Burkholderia thailandensis TaxID=57975 RepID=UPI000AE877C9|nr:hypothetical protein [Burkholderia thailandensis]
MADIMQLCNIDQYASLIRDIRVHGVVAHPKIKAAIRELQELDRLQALNSDLRTNAEFQRCFVRFFKVRRNAQWQAKFFDRLTTALLAKNTSFEWLLAEVLATTGKVEASFVSKGITRIDRCQPTVDGNVLGVMKNFFPEMPWSLLRIGSPSAKTRRAIAVHCALGQVTHNLLATTEWADLEKEFDCVHGQSGLTAAKKLDLLLWTYGSGKSTRASKRHAPTMERASMKAGELLRGSQPAMR